VVGARLGSAVPVPVRLAVWGLLVALSVTFSVALRAARAVGAKVTLIVQVAPTAKLAPQLLVCAKSPALAPVKPILLMVNTTPLEFASVTACDPLVVPTFWPLKVRVVGKRLGGAVPVPTRPAAWGLLLASSVTVSVAPRVPVPVGVKVTLMVQLFPAARLVPQLLVCPKSPPFAPVTAMPLIVKAVAPGFASVRAWDALAVPIVWAANVSVAGERVGSAVPVPARLVV
jgi:hypothetical protein